MSSGASTPPEVPDPSAIAQIIDFTRKMPSMASNTMWPRSNSAMMMTLL